MSEYQGAMGGDAQGQGAQSDRYQELMRRLQYGETITPGGWMRYPQKKMLMSPLMSSAGALIAFFTVVIFIVWLPTNTFDPAPSRFWTPLSNADEHGRQVYLDNGCIYCHSSFSRPQDVAAGLLYLYPRTSFSGDYYGNYEQSPNILGTERTGPDLTFEAGMHPYDWEVAHYYNPRSVEPISLMPRFSFLNKTDLQGLVLFNDERSGKDGLIRTAIQVVAKKLALMSMGPKSALKGTIANCVKVGKGKYKNCGMFPPFDFTPAQKSFVPKWVYVTGTLEGGVGHPGPAKDMKKYGKNGATEPDEFSILTHDRSYWLANDPLPVTEHNLLRGREIVQQRCVGCHGSTMNGAGPAAPFLSPAPIDFTVKDDACCGPDTAPGDLYYRILLGVPGTGMHNFGEQLSVEDIWRVVLFLKTIPNGGLTAPVPLPSMYIQWRPTAEIKDFIKSYPITKNFAFQHPKPLTDPFMIAARSIVPGLGVGEKFYLYGKGYTLRDVANMIKAVYKKRVTQAYMDAVGRHESGLPPYPTLCCSRADFYKVLSVPPTYFELGQWPKGELAWAKKQFKISVPKVANNYLAELGSNY